MKLLELFDKAAEYSLKSSPQGTITGEFSVDSHSYHVYFKLELPVTDAAMDAYDMEDMEDIMSGLEEQPAYGIEFELVDETGKGGRSDITGTGNEYTVFSTVLALTAEVIQSKNPVELHFISMEKSRTKLYNRLVKTLASKYGYVDFSKDIGARTGMYVLVRKDLV